MLGKMRVVSFCHYLQGPAAVQYLADMGADVVKVEPRGGAFERHWSGAKTFVEGYSAFFMAANRNKRCISIDLKHPDSSEIMERLIDNSDVLVENFRPGVMDRLGFGYDEVKKRKPNIIYASATGFGASGPMRDRPGQDLLIQALSGLVAATGAPDRWPTPVGCAVVDQHGGALLAMGILGAYVRLLTTGEGTRVEANLLNAGIDLQTEPLTLYFSRRTSGKPLFRRDPHLATWYHPAPYGVYRMADGFIVLSLNDPTKLAAALESDRLAALRDVDLFDDRDRYARVLAEELASRRYDDVADAFDALGLWYARVHDYDELKVYPQVVHNTVFREISVDGTKATLVNHPNRYDGRLPGLRHLALRVGEDTRDVLADLGYRPSEIDRFVENKVVSVPVDEEHPPTWSEG